MKSLAGLEIEVKPIDIKKGIPGDCDSCPVARAFIRTSRVKQALVFVEGTIIGIAGYQPYHLPKRAQNWIAKFDAGQPVKPMKFRIGKQVKS